MLVSHFGVFLQVVWWLVGPGRTYAAIRAFIRCFVSSTLLAWSGVLPSCPGYANVRFPVIQMFDSIGFDLQLAGAVPEVCTLELDTPS
jgi:hypothetical protein